MTDALYRSPGDTLTPACILKTESKDITGNTLIEKGRFTVDEVELRGAPDTVTFAPAMRIFGARSIPGGKSPGMTRPSA